MIISMQLKVGGSTNGRCYFITAHFLLSACFITVQIYKRMLLITQVYGMYNSMGNCMFWYYCIAENFHWINISPSPDTCVL